MTTNVKPTPKSKTSSCLPWVGAAILVVLAVVLVAVYVQANRFADDARRCASDGGCADELPGRWSGDGRTLTLDGDGTFIARGDGGMVRGTWDAYERQICFRSAGEIECLAYQYMGDMMVLDGAAYGRQ